jgi:hypothetical protein
MNEKFLKLASLAIATASMSLYGASHCAPVQKDPCVCFERGETLEECLNIPAAYNMPASVLTDNCLWFNNLYIDLSATYWFIEQEGLNAGRSEVTQNGETRQLNGKFFRPNFEYKPGFKVGLGARADDWVLYSEYTWVRSSISRGGSAPPVPEALGTGVWSVFPWFLQRQENSQEPLLGSHLSLKWKLHMDLLDTGFSRPYYQGPNLTVTPYAGIRTAWIRQNYRVKMTAIPQQHLVSSNSSYCWGIGPRLGGKAHCLFPKGFRTQGNIATSLLYTKYTHTSHKETNLEVGYPSFIYANENNVNTVRPSLEMGLGLGWGAYSNCRKAHIDFSLDYDFAIFWNQNRMRSMLSELYNGVPASYDLHTHGATLTGKFDF